MAGEQRAAATEKDVKFLNDHGYKIGDVAAAQKFIDGMPDTSYASYCADRDGVGESKPPVVEEAPGEKAPVYRVLSHIQHNKVNYLPKGRGESAATADYPTDNSGVLNPKLFTEKELNDLIASGAVRKE